MCVRQPPRRRKSRSVRYKARIAGMREDLKDSDAFACDLLQIISTLDPPQRETIDERLTAVVNTERRQNLKQKVSK